MTFIFSNESPTKKTSSLRVNVFMIRPCGTNLLGRVIRWYSASEIWSQIWIKVTSCVDVRSSIDRNMLGDKSEEALSVTCFDTPGT